MASSRETMRATEMMLLREIRMAHARETLMGAPKAARVSPMVLPTEVVIQLQMVSPRERLKGTSIEVVMMPLTVTGMVHMKVNLTVTMKATEKRIWMVTMTVSAMAKSMVVAT